MYLRVLALPFQSIDGDQHHGPEGRYVEQKRSGSEVAKQQKVERQDDDCSIFRGN